VERVDPDPIAPERVALRQWLDYHRATLMMKATGVNDEGARRTVTPGGLTLLGLVRHLTDVERYWFEWFFMGDDSADPYYWTDDNPDGDHFAPPEATIHEALGTYGSTCQRSREIEATALSLDQVSVRLHRVDGAIDLRWIMLHMIEETARHNGHADLLREAADGTVGD
jgi:hypothetical protein